jgi:hypothetical protein
MYVTQRGGACLQIFIDEGVSCVHVTQSRRSLPPDNIRRGI